MRQVLKAALGAAAMVVAGGTTFADDRQAVEMPPQVRDMFLTEMRGHLGELDDVLTALAAGDFKGAAQLAEDNMQIGHRMIARMKEMGASPEQVEAMRQHMSEMHDQMGGMGMGMGMGFGRFMPEEFRAMGAAFHEAAADFAKTARAASEPPTAEDYKAVIGALNAVTVACRGCHDAFSVR